MRSFFWALSAAVTFVVSNAVQAATVTIDFEDLRPGDYAGVRGSSGTQGSDDYLSWLIRKPFSVVEVFGRTSFAGSEFGDNSITDGTRRENTPFIVAFNRPVSRVLFTALRPSLADRWSVTVNAFSSDTALGPILDTDSFSTSGPDIAWESTELSVSGRNIRSLSIFNETPDGGNRVHYDNFRVTLGDDSDSPIAAVPLPASVMNLGMGFALIAALPFVRRRRARNAT